ncbi:MAG: hypothetical protein QNJ35_04860 [Paracoccaceae bacterium]|nr:hypothetical protein [Paracoccaceae bacterium]
MRLRNPFRFFASENGSMSIEAAIAAPMLIWAIAVTFVAWDGFKTMNLSTRAAYTVADALSRETDAVDRNYLSAMHETYGYLVGSDDPSAMRVTVVQMFEDPDTKIKELQFVWSEGVGGIEGYSNVEPIRNRVPIMAPGDQMIIVETEQTWSPDFSVGVGSVRLYEVALSRPRFSGQLVWKEATPPTS